MTRKHADTDNRLRNWLARHAPGASRRLAPCVGVLTSLLLVGCGPTPNFEDVGIGQTGEAGAGEVSITVPPGENGGGDLLVAILGAPGNPNTSGPEGWTPVPGFRGFNDAMCQADGQGTACQLSVFYKIADGSESTATFSWGGSRQVAAAVLRYSNVDTDRPIGASNQQRGSADTVTAPVVETTRDGSRALRIALVELDEAGPFVREAAAMSDVPPGERLNILSFPTAADDPENGCGPPMAGCDTDRAVALAVSDTRHRTAGPSGPASWELPAADQWLTATIEIRLAPGQ